LGVDYLKYDWYPIQLPATLEIYNALRHSGRDILFSLSNSMNITNGPTIGKIANSWRTTGDIKANWNSERGVHPHDLMVPALRTVVAGE
jgi:alpha-galactosidase